MDNSTKSLFLVMLASLPLSVSATETIYHEEMIINTTAELKDWCKNESSMYFLAHDITPYNWTASWWTDGNILHVKGTWEINEKETAIKCSVRRGVSEKYAVWKIVKE
jgi:hypothetical protein